MKRSAILRSSLCITALLCSIFAASAQELVTNGGFENGFSGWTINDPSDFTVIGTDPGSAHSGVSYANLGAFGLPLGSLSQTLTTTPGGLYNLTFSLTNDASVLPNAFEVLWNGVSLLSFTDGPQSMQYVDYSFTNLVATDPATTLEFRHRNDQDYFRLDDVSVSAVPEASTASLALLGLGLVGFLSYRRIKAHRAAGSR